MDSDTNTYDSFSRKRKDAIFVISLQKHHCLQLKIRKLKNKAVEIRQVQPTDLQVGTLIEKLNIYQIGLYGIEQCTLEAPEEMIRNGALMLGAFLGEELVGMGAIKLLEDYGELKRMYVSETHRGLGIASKILKSLEDYAFQNALNKIRLETGNLHFAAMAFYKQHGYQEISRFGSYADNKISVCFEKTKKKFNLGSSLYPLKLR